MIRYWIATAVIAGAASVALLNLPVGAEPAPKAPTSASMVDQPVKRSCPSCPSCPSSKASNACPLSK